METKIRNKIRWKGNLWFPRGCLYFAERYEVLGRGELEGVELRVHRYVCVLVCDVIFGGASGSSAITYLQSQEPRSTI